MSHNCTAPETFGVMEIPQDRQQDERHSRQEQQLEISAEDSRVETFTDLLVVFGESITDDVDDGSAGEGDIAATEFGVFDEENVLL